MKLNSESRRQTNLELFRILSMLIIVAHHYVVNSGIPSLYDYEHPTFNQLFLQIFACLGKTGINCFTLITGYFLVDKRSSVKRSFTLWSEFLFWQILLTGIFLLSGYANLSFKEVLMVVLSPVFLAGKYYVETVIFLFLLIPFLNRITCGISKKTYFRMLAVLIFYFSIISTFSVINDTWNFPGWLITVYLIGGYIKLHPSKISESLVSGLISLIASLLLMCGSIILIQLLDVHVGYYYMVSDANKILPLIASVSMFIVAKNIRLRHSHLINLIASACFGILCIHANSDIMRKFLWKDLFDNMSWFESQWCPLHAVGSTLLVFFFCLVLVLIQKKIVGKTWGKLMDWFWNMFVTVYCSVEKKVMEFL